MGGRRIEKDRLRKEAGTAHVMSFMLLPLWFLASVAPIRYASLHAKWEVSFSLSLLETDLKNTAAAD
jgi:hypothetical protein